MNHIQTLIDDLVAKYKYKPLPSDISQSVRAQYRRDIPSDLCEAGELTKAVISPQGVLLASGYTRIVVGDYGAYLEIPQVLAYKSSFIVAPGQEYRVNDPKYKDRVKYIWLTTHLNDIKIYRQMKPVTYADYKPDFFYVSPYEIKLSNG